MLNRTVLACSNLGFPADLWRPGFSPGMELLVSLALDNMETNPVGCGENCPSWRQRVHLRRFEDS